MYLSSQFDNFKENISRNHFTVELFSTKDRKFDEIFAKHRGNKKHIHTCTVIKFDLSYNY